MAEKALFDGDLVESESRRLRAGVEAEGQQDLHWKGEGNKHSCGRRKSSE